MNKRALRITDDLAGLKQGFTLIELIVTIAIAAILLTIAIPNFRTFSMNNRMATQANDLITALNLARSEAVKRSANVTVCASSDGATCAGAWSQGWVVRDPAGAVIRVQQALSGNSTLSGGAEVAASVTFTANGDTTIPTGASPADTTLALCPPSPPPDSVYGRAIQIERTGRVQVQVKDGINGRPAVCS